MTQPTKVHTTLGSMTLAQARALRDMTDHDGIVPLRSMMKTRQTLALAALTDPTTPPARLDFERGALAFVLELAGILAEGIHLAYADALAATESEAHGPDSRRPGREQERDDERGPE